LKHEVDGKTIVISSNGLNQYAWLDIIKRRQVGAKHDLLTAHQNDGALNSFQWYQTSVTFHLVVLLCETVSHGTGTFKITL
jgi:hypothetical protein